MKQCQKKGNFEQWQNLKEKYKCLVRWHMNANVEYKKRSVLKQWTTNTYRSKIEDNGKHKMQRSDPNGCILCNVVWRSELFSKTKR